MSLLPRCTVCDASLSPYGGETRCERCSGPCPTCGGNVSQCHHPLADVALQAIIVRDLRFTMELQKPRRAA